MTAVLTRTLIPGVIHHIWLGGPLPERERDLVETWRRHHPQWQLRLWLDADVPPLANQALFDATESPAQRADLLRYELLLAHGGIAVGADLECRRSIEPLLDGAELFCVRDDDFRLTDDLIGCVPGHPAIAAMVAALPDSMAWHPSHPRDEQTGADLLTRVIAEQEALDGTTAAVFGPERFFPYHWMEPHRAAEPFPDAYTVRRWRTPEAAEERTRRILVLIDPDLVETATVVVAGALDVAASVPGAELALVVKGVRSVTEAVGEAMAALVGQLAGNRPLPDVMVYGEPEGAALDAAVRVAMSDSAAENARTLLALAAARPSLAAE
ncbi:glycosyltransferase family 32 protein [Dactylosporangium sp. CA-139066]|uniref:glycosyltransferase family 32 protein n=1 Tax=Dactylosporangium sp. CA-139066 TaxID=3239930 RepID=UPI003D8E6F06